MLAFAQHLDAVIDLLPFGGVRGEGHGELCASCVALFRHIFRRSGLRHVNRLSKAGRAQPRPREAEGPGRSARRAISRAADLCRAQQRVRSAPNGLTHCWRRSRLGSSRLRSPTRRRGSPGRCLSGRKIIGLRCLLLHERPAQTRQRIEKFFLGRVIMA